MSEKINFILRLILFAVVHSLFATAWVRKCLQVANSQGYRLCYNAVSLAMFGWVMSAYRHSDVLYVAPGVWSLIMYLLQLVAVVILVSCLLQTGVGKFFGFTKSSPSSFTNSGWYSIVRHPLYFFSTMFMIMNPVMTSQWLILTIMGTAYFITGSLIEERRLTAEFGETYRHYQQRVPFFIPKLAKLKLSFTST